MSRGAIGAINNGVVILGAGIAGLAAGYHLSRAGRRLLILERDAEVGGLARTMVKGSFRFDLGGHRFFTSDAEIDRFVRELLRDEALLVPRKSKILLGGRFFNYPLKPANAILGMGLVNTVKILLDYGKERLRRLRRTPEIVSLEDWVVHHFGRTLFNLYFRDYSEKVWGTPCSQISMEWVAERIKGLSLASAIKNAFVRSDENPIATLTEEFIYPARGIGRLSERLKGEIERNNTILLNAEVERLCHDHTQIEAAVVRNGRPAKVLAGAEFISSIPLTSLIKMLEPKPPADVLEAADSLRYRDLVVVAVLLNRRKVTDLTWIYLPEKRIPFNRIHEPKNWSVHMAPPDKSLLVAEYCCFGNEAMWRMSDEKLAEMTLENLVNLGLVRKREALEAVVVRVPKAYPMLEVGYQQHHRKMAEYLRRFRNLEIAGRGGMFRYHNMDRAIRTGIEAANRILERAHGHLTEERSASAVPRQPDRLGGRSSFAAEGTRRQALCS